MNEKRQVTEQHGENFFEDMGFVKFWIVSTIFWVTFPVSLVVCFLMIGPLRTKQLIKALINDFLQTILFALVVFCILIYVIYQYVSGLF